MTKRPLPEPLSKNRHEIKVNIFMRNFPSFAWLGVTVLPLAAKAKVRRMNDARPKHTACVVGSSAGLTADAPPRNLRRRSRTKRQKRRAARSRCQKLRTVVARFGKNY